MKTRAHLSGERIGSRRRIREIGGETIDERKREREQSDTAKKKTEEEEGGVTEQEEEIEIEIEAVGKIVGNTAQLTDSI